MDGCDDRMRLGDLILALKAQRRSAIALMQRIDPAVADELRAYAAHRHIDLTDLAADCLEHVAADAADAIWQLAIERRRNLVVDPEAALLGDVLQSAIRARLMAERQIVSSTSIGTVFVGFRRSGHPYTMA
jgi:hypothetical protein